MTMNMINTQAAVKSTIQHCQDKANKRDPGDHCPENNVEKLDLAEPELRRLVTEVQ